MSLSAAVMCNCLRERRTTVPPFPYDAIVLDNEGELTLSSRFDSDANWMRLRAWTETACPHPRFHQVWIQVANWAGYRRFQHALEFAGWERFPTLHKYLPHSNAGELPAAACSTAIQELHRVRLCDMLGEETVLRDVATGAIIQTGVAAYDGVFLQSGSQNITVALEAGSFIVRGGVAQTERFRTQHLRQLRPDGTPPQRANEPVVWIDVPTGATFPSVTPITGNAISQPARTWWNWWRPVPERFTHPTELRVELRTLRAEDFRDILQVLQRVMEAACETGNPVRWR